MLVYMQTSHSILEFPVTSADAELGSPLRDCAGVYARLCCLKMTKHQANPGVPVGWKKRLRVRFSKRQSTANASSSALTCLDRQVSSNDVCSVLHVPQPHSLGF